MIRSARPLRPYLLSLSLLLSVAIAPACGPDEQEREEMRQGYLGEFCEETAQCRGELVCARSQCVDLSGGGDPACDRMCDRLVNTCGRDEQDCGARCEATIKGWSQQAVEIFEECTVGMSTPELTCEMARDEDAPSFCYAQLPLPDERQGRCDAFVQRARDTITMQDGPLTNLRTVCYIVARTRPETNPSDPVNSWSKTQICAANDLSEQEFRTCLNQVFPGVDL